MKCVSVCPRPATRWATALEVGSADYEVRTLSGAAGRRAEEGWCHKLGIHYYGRACSLILLLLSEDSEVRMEIVVVVGRERESGWNSSELLEKYVGNMAKSLPSESSVSEAP